MYIYIFAFLLLVSREKSIASPPTRQPRWLRIKIEIRKKGDWIARTERRENAMLGKKGWKPGSVLQKIARSNESFLLIELITTPSPISFPHIFERNVGNGAARCAVNQHRSANRIEKKIGRNWSSIIASSLSLSPFSKNCSKVNGCLNTVGARCPAFQLINETRRAGVESRGGGMENQERAAVILG